MIVELSYADVQGAPTPATRAAVAAAFGPAGLGLLLVRAVPRLPALRGAALPHAFALGALPPAALAPLEHAASTFSVGWSRGRESFGGARDTAKGSYYFNPLADAPCAGSAAAADPALAPFYAPNVWPDARALPASFASFEGALKALGAEMVAVGAALAAHVDAHVAERAAALGRAPGAALADVVARSRTPKARLLYYFPREAGGGSGGGGESGADGAPAAAWCGAHNDHGSLTALTPALFFDAAGAPADAPPDAAAGLFVFSRGGAWVRAAIPPDALAFQIGETAQIASGGLLRATPHVVRAPAAPGVSRGTLAVFMEPEHDGAVAAPPGVPRADVLASDAALPPGVPRLGDRWVEGDTFATFTSRTLAAYY